MFPFQNWRGVCGDFCPRRAGLSFDGSDDIVLPVAGTSFPAGLGFRRFLVARLFLGRELPLLFLSAVRILRAGSGAGLRFRCCRRLFVRIKILLLFVQIGRVWIWRMISGDRGDRTDLRKVPLPPCRSGNDSPIRSPCVHPRVSSVMWGKCFRAAS